MSRNGLSHREAQGGVTDNEQSQPQLVCFSSVGQSEHSTQRLSVSCRAAIL